MKVIDAVERSSERLATCVMMSVSHLLTSALRIARGLHHLCDALIQLAYFDSSESRSVMDGRFGTILYVKLTFLCSSGLRKDCAEDPIVEGHCRTD